MSKENKAPEGGEQTTAPEGQDVTVSKAEFDALQTKYDEAQTSITDLSGKLEGMVSVDDFTSVKTQLDDLKNKQANDSNDPETVEARAREIAQERIDVLEAEKGSLSKSLKEVKLVDGIMSQLDGILPASKEYVKADILKSADLDDSNNIFFKGEDGKPKYKDANVLYSVEDFKADHKAKSPMFYEPTVKAGGMSSNSKEVPASQSQTGTVDYERASLDASYRNEVLTALGNDQKAINEFNDQVRKHRPAL